MRNERTLPEALQRTSLDNLWCLTAGACDELARQALDKDRLRKILERARQEFDYVVIDTCSLQESVDPLYLAQRADAAATVDLVLVNGEWQIASASGAQTPARDLADLVLRCRASIVALSATVPRDLGELSEQIGLAARAANQSGGRVIVGGTGMANVSLPEGAEMLRTMRELELHLGARSPRP